MIPLYVFLIAWLIFLGLYAILSLISVLQMLRFGVSGVGTYLTTLLFLFVGIGVIIGAAMLLKNTDWKQYVSPFSWIAAMSFFQP